MRTASWTVPDPVGQRAPRWAFRLAAAAPFAQPAKGLRVIEVWIAVIGHLP